MGSQSPAGHGRGPLLVRQLLLALAGAILLASAVALGLVVFVIAAVLITASWAGYMLWIWWLRLRGGDVTGDLPDESHGTIVEGEFEIVKGPKRPGHRQSDRDRGDS